MQPQQPGTSTLQRIPLSHIAVSQTQVQQLRRKRFKEDDLRELATSLQKMGQLQPVLVRPAGAAGRYELVLGERRYLACERAGLPEVIATVSDLNDTEALSAQLVENLQRQDLDPMEEAQGYAELRELTGFDAKALGEKVGKSRSWVYSRLELLKLSPEIRDEIAAGDLHVSKALLIAKFRHPKLQAKALEKLHYAGGWSVRRCAEELTRLMASLADAPFRLDDARVIEIKVAKGDKASFEACTGCQWNSANDRELTEAMIDGAGDPLGAHCLETACYDSKVARASAELRAELERDGKTIITGDQAAAIVQQYGGLNGYVDLDDTADVDFPEKEPDDAESPEWDAWSERQEKWVAPTWRALLGDGVKPADVAYIENPRKTGDLIEALPAKVVRAIVKAKKIALNVDAPEDFEEPRQQPQQPRQDPAAAAAQRAKQEAAEKAEAEYRQRLLRAIYAKWKPPFKRQDWELLAEAMFGKTWEAQALGESLGIKQPSVTALKDDELQRLLVLDLLRHDVESYGKPGRLLAYAQRFKIDAKALKKGQAAAPAKKKTKKK